MFVRELAACLKIADVEEMFSFNLRWQRTTDEEVAGGEREMAKLIQKDFPFPNSIIIVLWLAESTVMKSK